MREDDMRDSHLHSGASSRIIFYSEISFILHTLSYNSYIMHAKNKCRSCVVTLLCLANSQFLLNSTEMQNINKTIIRILENWTHLFNNRLHI